MSSLSRHRKRLINAAFEMSPRHSSCLVVLVDMTTLLLLLYCSFNFCHVLKIFLFKTFLTKAVI